MSQHLLKDATDHRNIHMVIKIYKLLNELQGRCREHVTPGIDSVSNDNTNPLWYITTFKNE